MSRTAKTLRYVAFALMALFGLLGGVFIAGEAFADPGGWRAITMTAAWSIPLIALSVYAVRKPRAAGPLFVAATVLGALFTVVDSAFGIVPRGAGPVGAVAIFVLAVALAFLGLHRAKLAGLLMVGAGASLLAATLGRWGGSSGAVALPILVLGLVFLLAAVLDHQGSRPERHAGRGRRGQTGGPRMSRAGERRSHV